MKVSVDAPAKINLYLDILSRRSDGYHVVAMVMQTVELFDRVNVAMAGHGRITVASDIAIPSLSEKNTAYIAARAFFKHTNVHNPGVDIHIEKKIPMGAGLAGGSADAAAVLVALNHMFACGLSDGELADIGRAVGSDVPFCVLGGTMMATGVGTDLARLNDIPPCYITISKPKASISTHAAYKKFDEMPSTPNKPLCNMISVIKNGDLTGIASCLYNKFEDVVQLNEVMQIKRIMRENSALGACMTGSGSAVFGIFDKKELSIRCKSALKEIGNYENVYLVGPTAHGCRITAEEI